MSEMPTPQEKTSLPKWVEIWLACLVTALIAGLALDKLAPSFAETAKDLIQYGLGLVTGIYIQLRK